MSTHSPQHQIQNDEIDLIEVVKTLWAYKWTVIITTFIFVVVTYVVCFFITPIYQLQATLKPPLASEVAALDFSELPVSHENIHSIKANDAFNIFYDNLTSESLRQEFFNQYYWPEITKSNGSSLSRTAAYSKLLRHLKIRKDPKTGAVEMSFSGNDPERLLPWFKQFLDVAEKASKQQIQQNIASQIAVMRDGLETKIDMKRSLAKEERMDRVVQLKEAIKVASAVSPNRSSTIVINQFQNKLVLVEEPGAMYLRDVKALKIEMDNLLKRSSDDAFIPDLRQLASNLQFYQNFTPRLEEVVLYSIDGNVRAPETPISPNRNMLLLLTLVLGILIGCLLVFIRTQLKK